LTASRSDWTWSTPLPEERPEHEYKALAQFRVAEKAAHFAKHDDR
jgi:hypothetical protein